MSTTQLAENLSRLRREGLPASTPAALIRWGTMPGQQTIVGTLGDLADQAAALRLRPPTVVVVGEVVRLRGELSWFEKRPLFGRTIVVTRARHQARAFIEELEALGAGVVHVPCIDVRAPTSSAELDDALRRLERYEWIVFTSVNGVHAFLDRLAAIGGDTRRLGCARLAAIGSETAKALEDAHLRADVVPSEFRAEGLAAALGPDAVRGRHVLLPRAAGARRVLSDTLRAFGASVDDVVAYRVETPEGGGDDVRRRLDERSVDLVTFASSTTVRHFVDLVGADAVRAAVSREQPPGRGRVLVGCIGPVTAGTARELGLPVDVQPQEYTIAGFTRAIVAGLGHTARARAVGQGR
jgi:uroporphyrinogen III methyltransferase/synthase